MTQAAGEIWFIIAGLGIGTFLIRFSFLGLIGSRPLPPWVLRHLRYTPVAVLPALIAPLVLWPEAAGGEPDLPRISAAVATLALGMLSKNVILSIAGGAGTLYLGLYLAG